MLTTDVLILLGYVHTHAYSITVLLLGYHNQGTPFIGLSHWGIDALVREKVYLLFEFILVNEGEGSDAEWSSIVYERDMKCLPRHHAILAI